MTQLIPTEADREAAAKWAKSNSRHAQAANILRGSCDTAPLVQLFASHALAARIEALEEAARKARELYLFPPPTSQTARFHQRVTQDAISDAIRSLIPTGAE